jgi:hypothetical protein
LAASFIPRLRPCSYGYSSLWKTVRCLISGAVFHSEQIFQRGAAPMRPFVIPDAMDRPYSDPITCQIITTAEMTSMA